MRDTIGETFRDRVDSCWRYPNILFEAWSCVFCFDLALG